MAADTGDFVGRVEAAQRALTEGIAKAGLQRDPFRFPLEALAMTVSLWSSVRIGRTAAGCVGFQCSRSCRHRDEGWASASTVVPLWWVADSPSSAAASRPAPTTLFLTFSARTASLAQSDTPRGNPPTSLYDFTTIRIYRFMN